MNNLNRFFGCVVLLATMLSAGCSTLEGMGKDMQSIGQGMNGSTTGNTPTKSEPSTPASGAVVTPIK